jgi:hypothetical protein
VACGEFPSHINIRLSPLSVLVPASTYLVFKNSLVLSCSLGCSTSYILISSTWKVSARIVANSLCLHRYKHHGDLRYDGRFIRLLGYWRATRLSRKGWRRSRG